MGNYFENKDLLAVPAKRAAFSDRTAYLMAEMSRLAYFKFEGGSDIEDIIEQVRKLFPKHNNRTVLESLAMLVEVLLTPLTGLFERVKQTKWYKKSEELLLDAQRYRQSGYGSFLVGRGDKARLRYSVDWWDKLFWWSKQFFNFFRWEFKLLSDHSIQTYSEKLETWANSRR